MILVVGDIITDILAVHSGPIEVGSDTPAAITITGGGSAANTAAWLASLGVPVALAGVVGDDVAGADRLTELAESGVDCTAVRRAAGAATGSIVVLVGAAERSFLCDRGANSLLQPADIPVAGVTHVHLSGYTLFDPVSRPAALRALRLGVQVSVDASSAAPLRRVGPDRFLDWVRGADLLLANLDEARTLVGADAAPAVLAGQLATVTTHAIVKLGPEGAVLAGPDGILSAPAVPARSVTDPTGAGDAFAAGYLAATRAGHPPAQALADAARQGTIAVTHKGGRPPR